MADNRPLLLAQLLKDVPNPLSVGIHGGQATHGYHAEAKLMFGSTATDGMHRHGTEQRGRAGLVVSYRPHSSGGFSLLENRAVIHGLVVHDEPGNVCNGACGVVNDFP